MHLSHRPLVDRQNPLLLLLSWTFCQLTYTAMSLKLSGSPWNMELYALPLSVAAEMNCGIPTQSVTHVAKWLPSGHKQGQNVAPLHNGITSAPLALQISKCFCDFPGAKPRVDYALTGAWTTRTHIAIQRNQVTVKSIVSVYWKERWINKIEIRITK